MDCCLSAPAPLHVPGDGAADRPAGATAAATTPTDIFPEINIPVISIVWIYNGLSPQDMADRITANRAQPHHAPSTTSSTSNRSRCRHRHHQDFLPAGRQHSDGHRADDRDRADHVRSCRPARRRRWSSHYTASTIPIIQLGLSSQTLPEQELFDLRPELPAHPPGHHSRAPPSPIPTAARARQIQVDLDTEALLAKGLTPRTSSTRSTPRTWCCPPAPRSWGRWNINSR